MCVFICFHVWCIYQLSSFVSSFFERSSQEFCRRACTYSSYFIYRILLFLGLADFPSGELIHVVAPLGATFLRQRAAHLRVDPSGPRGASSGDVPPPPFSTSAAAVDIPPPTTSDDSDIRRTLDHVLTVQAAQGQILVDVLDEIRCL